jgi:hypothetical protein
MTEIEIDGYSIDYKIIQNLNYFECNIECLKEPRCAFAFRISTICAIKALPPIQNQKPCDRGVSSCWAPKEYQNYATLVNFPFDSIYRFQVSVYDEFSSMWTARSDLSRSVNYKINLNIRSQKIDEFSQRILMNQEETSFQVSRYRLLIAKNNGVLDYDQIGDANLRRYLVPSKCLVWRYFSLLIKI